MILTPIQDLIQLIVGTTYYTLEMASDGITPLVVYSLEYILGGLLLILFNVGIFVLILNFQKSFFYRRSK